MNVLEQILMEIKEYTESVYRCNIDKIVEYQGKHGEDPCTYIVQGIAEATDIICEYMTSALDPNSQGNWIPCSERLPHEHDSIFAKFKGTDTWSNAMFERRSDNVNVTIEFKDGKRKAETSYTIDGKWKCEKEYRMTNPKVLAWQPLPEPYKGEYSYEWWFN